MPPQILFFVSGHGFGHARRSAQIIASLQRRDPALRIVIRTAAPAHIFHRVGVPPEHIQPTQLDAGVTELNAITIDPQGTADRVEQLMANRNRIVAEEVDVARAIRPTLILTDIPWLAGDVAEQLSIPCVATGNFTWDFIYEQILTEWPGMTPAVASIAASYRKMAAVLRQPFAHAMPQFMRVINVPLVAARAQVARDEAWRRIAVGPPDSRKRILIGMRGGTSATASLAASRSAPDLIFTMLQPVPPEAPENLRQIHDSNLDFTDILAAHDAIVTKLGYGIVSECIANNVRILWPPRTGFAEDPLFLPQAPRWTPMREISRDDYLSGRWDDHLHNLLAAPPATELARVDGADTCAEWLLAGNV